MKPKKRGQPSKYREEYGDMLIEHCAAGGFIEKFAHSIGVHKDTIYEWASKHPDFSDSLKRARQVQQVHFMDLGYSLANGTIKGQVAAWCFMMKNMFGWRDVTETHQTINIDGIVFDSEYEPNET